MARGVWLIRHGETTAPPGLTIGSSDPPLSRVGVAQAETLAVELAGRPLSRIFASDLRRALATAEVIAARHELRVEIDARLRELDFGSWEGRVMSELWAEEPDSAQRWENDLRATPDSFGESLRRLETRVDEFWARLSDDSDGEVAVVAHRGSLAVLKALITGASLESVLAVGMERGTAVWLSRSGP